MLSSTHACHFHTFLGASFARLGTALAMIGFVLPALLAARAADLAADTADFLREFRSAGHETSGHPANDRALVIQIDTARHHLDVVFLQTRAGAVFALSGALIAGFDTASVLLMHNCAFSFFVLLLLSWSRSSRFRRDFHGFRRSHCPQCGLVRYGVKPF